MQHMIYALILSRALDSGDILWTFHHAYHAVVAPVIIADGAKVSVGIVLTFLAEMYIFMYIKYRVGESLCVLIAHTHNVIS